MSLAHLTLATRHVEQTASFLERTLGYRRDPLPANIPDEAVWLDLGRGQQLHVLFVGDFEISPFEREFGRHLALFHPEAEFAAIKARVREHGGELIDPIRPTPFARFFFREPVNGYVFEVVASHLDQ